MEAGKLRFLVTVKKPNRKEDSYGEATPAVADYSTVTQMRMEIKPFTALERIKGEKVQHEVTHLIRCRYTPLITPDCVLEYDGRSFNIFSLTNKDEADTELNITCIEITNPNE